MTWIIKLPEGEVSSDDFTIDDLDRIEKATGGYWSVMNPLAQIKVAKEFLRVALEHVGRSGDDVEGMTLGTVKRCFDFRPDEEEPVEEEVPTKGRKAPTRRDSSKS